MTDPTSDALAIAEAVRRGQARAEDVVGQALARIREKDGALNCFTAVFDERALADARAIDAAIAQGLDPGPLAGVPFAVKNLFDVKDVITLAGSILYAKNPPAREDATAVARLAQAGAIVVGALNLDEFAFGFTTENGHYGPTRNPHDRARIAGGSSGGSAAAVAAGMVPASLGSDTNGSVRVPASLCGVYGLKPTYGRVSRAGVVPLAWSFDHVGLFARSVRDVAALFDALQGPDARDPGMSERAVHLTLPEIHAGPRGLRIAIADGHFATGAEVEALAAGCLGATRRVTLPEVPRAIAASLIISAAEGIAVHIENLRTRAAEFDPGTRDRWRAAALLPSTWVIAAQRFRRWFRDQVAKELADIDVLIAPATAFAAPLIGQQMIKIGDTEVPVRAMLGRFTAPFSFVGYPALAVPIARPGALPLGVQLIAKPYEEAKILRAARALEAAGIAAAPVAG